MARQALTIAAHFPKPPTFGGTATAWRVLCDLYPAAETAEVIMAVLDYCTVRRLDPFKRPCHIVPIYNTRLRRKVQTVMQGINEIEITASRTGKWAGMEPADWGRDIERTFVGTYENDDGATRTEKVVLVYPEWCRITVYRMVGEQRAAFTEQLWWMESYGRAAFRSEVPNARWTQAPRQMLAKCVKAAVLRAAFPEEGLGYASEEMEGREVEDGGYTIDGKAEPAAPSGQANGGHAPQGLSSPPPPANYDISPRDREAARERMSETYEDPPAPTGADRLGHEPNGTLWLKLLDELAAAAATPDALAAIVAHPSVHAALETAPTLIKDRINDILRAAHERLNPPAADDPFPGDPHIERLLAQAREMSLDRIRNLPNDHDWQAATRDLFPTDFETIETAIAERRAELERQAKKGEPNRDDNA